MATKHTIIYGDSRNMSLIPNESVQLIVTSPPYWQLKDYGVNIQLSVYYAILLYMRKTLSIINFCKYGI